jgi:hypothetical protein
VIIPDSKRATTLILSRLSNGKRAEMPVNPEVEAHPDPNDEPLTIAAQDVMQAFNDKSILKLRDAMKAFFDLCDSMPEEGDEASE